MIERLWILLCLLPFSLFAEKIEVCSDCEHSSLNAAIQSALPGDSIWVKGDYYKEGEILIDKSLTVFSEVHSIIDADLKSGGVLITADSVVFEGFIVKNVSTSYIKDFAGIKVSRSDYFVIRNNELNNTFFGIFIEDAKHGRIENNKVLGEAEDQINSGNGIHLWQCKDIDIKDNIVEKHRDGIYFEFVDDSRIINNRSRSNLRYGLHFMFSNHDNYEDNLFENNGAGVAVMFSKYINMYRNTFIDNWGQSSYGLLLKEIYDGELMDNYFLRNTIGINAEGSNRIKIKRNTFEQNGWAIKILGACFNNSIEDNNFLYNSFDLAYNGHMNDNTFDGNYWSEYAGYDLDKDGIGDVPYRPVKLFNYVVNQVPESIIMVRSLFVYLIDFSEKVSPVFTPDELMDYQPKMQFIP